jgi:hypothetical protein
MVKPPEIAGLCNISGGLVWSSDQNHHPLLHIL